MVSESLILMVKSVTVSSLRYLLLLLVSFVSGQAPWARKTVGAIPERVLTTRVCALLYIGSVYIVGHCATSGTSQAAQLAPHSQEAN